MRPNPRPFPGLLGIGGVWRGQEASHSDKWKTGAGGFNRRASLRAEGGHNDGALK